MWFKHLIFFLFIALYIFIGIIHCSDWFLKLFIFLYKKNSKLPKSALINKIVFIQIRLLFLIIKKSRQAFRCCQPRREVSFGKQKQNNFFFQVFFFFYTLTTAVSRLYFESRMFCKVVVFNMAFWELPLKRLHSQYVLRSVC